MPEEQDRFQKQVSDILQVAIFENWLRFYFIHETSDNELELQIPAKSMERIDEHYANLALLAHEMNNKPITFETSRDTVLKHILAHVDGTKMEKGTAQKVLQSATFQTRLQLFHIWEQMHEDQLDQGFIDFETWKNLFIKWLHSPGAMELEKKLLANPETGK